MSSSPEIPVEPPRVTMQVTQCPTCLALLPEDDLEKHVRWHKDLKRQMGML